MRIAGTRARLRHREPVAGPQGPPVEAAEAGAGMGRGRAEGGREVEAAGHRQVGPGAGPARPDGEAAPRPQRQRAGRRQRRAVEADPERPAGERDPERSALRRHLDAAERDLERRGAEGVAERPVGGGVGQRVHRPGGGDAVAQVAVPAAVLERHAGAGREDAECRGHAALAALGDELSGGGAALEIGEGRGVDRREAQGVADSDRERVGPVRRVEPLRRAADDVPAGRHREGADRRQPAADQEGVRRVRRARRGAAGHGQLPGQPAQIGEARGEAVHVDPVLGPRMQGGDALDREPRGLRHRADILGAGRVVAARQRPHGRARPGRAGAAASASTRSARSSRSSTSGS